MKNKPKEKPKKDSSIPKIGGMNFATTLTTYTSKTKKPTSKKIITSSKY